MQNSKKIAIFTLSVLVLAGGVYIFRDSVLFNGLSSSALNTSFTCTESSLKAESAAYRQTKIRYKKALVLQKDLEGEIARMISTMSGEVQKKQDALKILKRQIGVYTRFIKKYDTCKREVSLYPSISPGIMSGEVKIISSLQNSYQELASFEISSPENLNTFLNTLQFQVLITPVASLAIDQWFLISDLSAPSPCESSVTGDNITIDCDMYGGMPSNIPSSTKNTYKLGAHIISVDQTVEGRIEISVAGMTFNDGREGFKNKTTPSILHYGVVPATPPVAPPEVIISTEIAPTPPPVIETVVTVTSPPALDPGVSSSETIPVLPETLPVVISPVPGASVSETASPPVVVEVSTPSTNEPSILPPTNEPSSDTNDSIELPPVPPEVPSASETNTSASDAAE